jgi:hypothetical protein
MLQKSWPLGRAKEKNWCAACSNIASDGLSPQCLIASPITAEFRFKSPGRTANAKKQRKYSFQTEIVNPTTRQPLGILLRLILLFLETWTMECCRALSLTPSVLAHAVAKSDACSK